MIRLQYRGLYPIKSVTANKRRITFHVVEAWSAWFETPCSVTCRNGSKNRLRHCSTGHADDCTGSHQETVPCTQHPFSVKCHESYCVYQCCVKKTTNPLL
ncbi:hypothetical protein DPMN_152710 [Dreissena polymorpha]|uniref:Uncharacterized protein n=1 Tax=Dreissena polymorpha TaxID=45954 RepID=A0A9D4FIT2_DREPO|nr:hypothetical protein DPMN_152710 [Dreissena polymorpha]